MQRENTTRGKLPIKSWCQTIENGALEQAVNLANHPHVIRHVALMADYHVSCGMPIWGVVACKDAVIPNAVGVDIGCGMCAVRTSFPAAELTRSQIGRIRDEVKPHVPLGVLKR